MKRERKNLRTKKEREKERYLFISASTYPSGYGNDDGRLTPVHRMSFIDDIRGLAGQGVLICIGEREPREDYRRVRTRLMVVRRR